MSDKQLIIWQRLEGAALLIASIALYAFLGFSWWLFALLLLAFDISMVGYLKDNKLGALLYNAGHSLIMPVLLGAAGVLRDNTVCQTLALIWIAHIGMDRAFGYGLKLQKSFKDTNLGKLK